MFRPMMAPVALRKMKRGFIKHLCYRGDRRLAGIVTVDRAVEAVNRVIDLRQIVETDIPVTARYAYPGFTSGGGYGPVPIAVIDEKRDCWA